MKWKRLIKEYFKIHKEGTSEDIKDWIMNGYLSLARQDVEDYVARYKLGRMYNKTHIENSAMRKIRETQCVTNSLRELFHEGLLKRKECLKGICEFVYYKEDGGKFFSSQA